MSTPRFRHAGTVFGTRDPDTLASFYERLLGWERFTDEADWVAIRPAGGGNALAFHTDVEYVSPTWPSRPDAQQMMMHVDFVTDDLEAALAHAVELGATVHDVQHETDEIVLTDPDGHPFCIIRSTNW